MALVQKGKMAKEVRKTKRRLQFKAVSPGKHFLRLYLVKPFFGKHTIPVMAGRIDRRD
jgi:hypothetical protein